MRHLVSVMLETLDLFNPDLPNLPIHGANLTTVEHLRRYALHERVEALEVFLPPTAMARTEMLAETAKRVLPPSLRGQGRLRFYPLHSIPDVWADAKPRTLLCLDPEWMPRSRYLRDRFAAGPMPVVCDSHGFGHHCLWGALSLIAAAPPVAFDTIVNLSVSSQRALEKMFQGFLSDRAPCRLDIIPRGVDTDLFHPHDAVGKADARRLLRLPLEAKITLFLGRVSAHSKADLMPLVRAFASVASEDDVLLIAGDEYPYGYGAKLLEFGASLGLGERILIHPRVLPAFRPVYFGAADLFVFPGDTVQETFGTTVLEAMASGLPCILSDWDGMRDLIRDGETGFAIPTWWMPELTQMDALSPAVPMASEYLYTAQRAWVDTERLTSALKTLLSSSDTRAAMGAAGRERAMANFAIPLVIDGWMDLWDTLAALAAQESETDRDARRADANRLGAPTPYDTLFSHYATSTIDRERDSVRLSAYGRQIASNDEQLQLYEETLPLMRPQIFKAIFDIFTQANDDWLPLGSLLDRAATLSEQPDAQIRLHLCLLLKRDVVLLRRDK